MRAAYILFPLGFVCVLGSCVDNKPLEKGLRVGPSVTRHTKKDQSLTVYSAYQVANDCIMYDLPPSIKITTPPSNGVATVVQVRDHPAYPKTSHLYKCNERMIPMTAVKYQPNPGFTGTDHLGLQTIFTGSLRSPDKTEIAVEVTP